MHYSSYHLGLRPLLLPEGGEFKVTNDFLVSLNGNSTGLLVSPRISYISFYLPLTIFFISFNLFSASIGVRLFTSKFNISSRI